MIKGIVLVTGGSGFVGGAVLRELLAHKYAVAATCRRSGAVAPATGVTWVPWDATADPLPDVDWSSVRAIVHLAAPRSLFDFPEGASSSYEIITGATFRLLEAARRHLIARVLLASTGDVLGPSALPATENDLLYSPSSFYGVTKACAELLCRGYESVIATATLRFYHPYGPGGERFLINRLLRMVQAGKEVTIEGQAGILLNPVWIDDLARGVRLALESRETGVFHFGGNETETLRALLMRIGTIVGRAAVIRSVPGPQIERHAGSFARSERVLGYRPDVSLDEGLRRIASG